MERALEALSRSPLYYTPDGWTLGEGRERFNSVTIGYLARHLHLVEIRGDEARLSKAGRIRGAA